jgi:hypothetical protein
MVLGQPGQPVPEPELCPEAAVRAVVYVTGDQQEVHPFPQAKVNQVIKGLEGGLAQDGQHVRRFVSNAAARAVQVQVSRMDKGKWFHFGLMSLGNVVGSFL